MKPAPAINAEKIIMLLSKRHKGDVFIPQCKDGASQSRDHFKQIDALAFVPTWTRNEVHGYEVKVSRADFLHDQKMAGYLEMCSCFWIVCPPEVCDLSEIPAQAGLINVTKNGTGLRTIKKAPIRQVAIPEDVYRYVLYHRVRPRGMQHDGEIDYSLRLEAWREFLAQDLEKKDISWRVNHKISKHVKDKLEELRTKIRDAEAVSIENERLKARVDQLLERQKIWDSTVNGPMIRELEYLIEKYKKREDSNATA